jgi:uroporphyrin-III C-methyltransferase/precorrin-2 dehydrogenase/sirohydrochlorin ferrochelatase
MIKLARQGKRVVRLKSGDPMIFGRAGEEIAELRAAGIGVDVVPGITAALAMASALGVSLTHRAHAQSLRLITGHGQKGDLPPGLDWAGLADPASTLVFYMAGRTAPDIVRRLLAHGLDAATPVVVVESLSRPQERRRAGRLSTLPALCADGFEGPVLIGIGQVFAAPAVAVAAPPKLSEALSEALSAA